MLLKDSSAIIDNGYVTHATLANLRATPYHIAMVYRFLSWAGYTKGIQIYVAGESIKIKREFFFGKTDEGEPQIGTRHYDLEQFAKLLFRCTRINEARLDVIKKYHHFITQEADKFKKSIDKWEKTNEH